MVFTWICETIVKSIHNSWYWWICTSIESSIWTTEESFLCRMVLLQTSQVNQDPKPLFDICSYFLYLLIILAGRDQLHPSADGRNSSSEPQLLARRKAAKMLIAVVVMFGICYLPVHLLNILRWVTKMSTCPVICWIHWGNSCSIVQILRKVK